MALITFNDKSTHLTGDIVRETPKATHLQGKHGLVIVPRAWVSHVTDGRPSATDKNKEQQ
jgi:hypothetical protein